MLSTYASIILSLFIVEVLLSVDNALVNATLAESLPEYKRKGAIRIGILAGAGFRIVALFLASIIIQNVWLKVLGGAYLIYLAMRHLGESEQSEGENVKPKETYWAVITQIAIADLIFSIDNVISAVSFSEELLVVMLGVGIGVVSMLFITPILSKLISKYKGMPACAYAIVGFIGISLILETLTSIHIAEVQKFIVVVSMCVFTVWYEHSKTMQRLFNPVLRSAQKVLNLPFRTIHAIRTSR